MTTMTKITLSACRRERGAALVVSMVLLMVLTLLAISTMRTASLEVTMAGNAQYAQNAFQLAETANEQYMRTMRANTALCMNDQNPTVCDIAIVNVPEMGGAFQTVNTFIPSGGIPCPNSGITVQRFDFQVLATGRSSDNALSQHTQGWTFCNP